jgi:hypothetical protein
MQYIEDKNIKSQLHLICGLINRAQSKQVVTTESLARDMIRHGIESYFRGDVELIEGEPDASKE